LEAHVDNDRVRDFFNAYQATANKLDVDALETFFADACLGAAPGFAGCTTDRVALRTALEGVVAFYRSVDRDVQLLDVETQTLGAYHALATVQWTASFPGVAAPIPFKVSYLLQRREEEDLAHDGVRIIAFISHEDEAAMLREHGIMPPE
jgi:hypothetical protein